MSSKDTGISEFLQGAEKLLRGLAAQYSLVFGHYVLTPAQGPDGGGFALHGQLGSNWIVLLVWGRRPWLNLEQCHVWWYIDDKPIVPDSSVGSPYSVGFEPMLLRIRPQFKRVVRSLKALEDSVLPSAEWIASTLIDQILVDAMASGWPRAHDASFIPITVEDAVADSRDALAEEPPNEEGDFA